MDTLLKPLSEALSTLSEWVWGPPMLILLVGTGILLTFRLRFLQFHKLPFALSLAFFRRDSGPRAEGDISHFQALMTALSATIGTGNILGVTTAMTIGGPGALFWMWMTALAGMATKYTEGILAVKYRILDARGAMCGGPMYYIEKGLGLKWLGVLFAIFGSIAAFGIGNMVQANSVSNNLFESTGCPTWASGLVMAVLTGVVILGGIKRIGWLSGWLVPIMAVGYILACLIVIGYHADKAIFSLQTVVHDAFTGTAAAGGFAGATVLAAMRKGVARGVFSNEAGLGSAPIAAAAARTKHPAEQAFVSMTGTFLDTIVVCTMTGLVLMVTGVWQEKGEAVAIAHRAFETGMPGHPKIGLWLLVFGMVTFAYSTIIGWAYYGEKCFEYLLGVKAVIYYRFAWVVFVFVGATSKLSLLWDFSDVMNGLMAIPNLIGLLGLSGVAVAETKAYLSQLEGGASRRRFPDKI